MLIWRALRRLPVFEDFVRGQQALMVGFAAAGFLADIFVDLRIRRIRAVLRLVTRVMANSGPQSEAHAENLLGPERARIPQPTSLALALPFRRMY